MFALVLFTDDILYICALEDVFVHRKTCSVKYIDKKKYAARVLALHRDNTTLITIKANLENATTCVENNWMCIEKHETITYAKASKEIIKNADSKILYADENILPRTNSNACINMFSLDSVNEQEDFFDNSSRFIQLKMVRSDDNKVNMCVPTATELQSNFEERESGSLSPYAAINSNETYTLSLNNIELPSSFSNDSEIEKEICKLETEGKLWFNADNQTPMNDTDIIQLENIPILIDAPTKSSTEEKFHVSTDGINELKVFIEKDSTLGHQSITCGINSFENNISLPLSESTPCEYKILEFENKEDAMTVINQNGNVSCIKDNSEEKSNINSVPKIIKTEIVNLPLRMIMSKGSAKTGRHDFSDDLNFDMANTNSNHPIMQSTMCESTNVDLSGNLESQATISGFPEDENNESDLDDAEDGNYQPPDEESAYSDNSSMDLDDRTFERAKKSDFSKSLNITFDGKYGKSAPDDQNLRVDNSTTFYGKKHFCVYCKKFQSKLARHLQIVHSSEEDVKKFIMLPPKNKERQEIIATIRKNGDHLYNTERKYNNGTLIVCRRPNARMNKTAEDFLSCGNCKGQYARSVIRHHWRKCTKRDGKRERIILVKGRKVAARLHERASHDVRKYIFPYMREDDVVRCIRYDELIVLYANKQCQKYGTHQHHYQMIRARLRLLGRFLNCIKYIDNRIKTFADIFQPRYYDAAIDAVRDVAGFNAERRIFDHPAVASNIGTLLKHVGELLRSEYIKKELEHEQKRVEDFLKLLAEDYGTNINRVVAETQTQNNRRKEIILPTTEDIKKLHTFIKTERCKYFSELTKKFTYHTWKKLAETTLLSLQIFNRRRPGEIERLYLDDFRSYRGIDQMADKESYNALSEEGKKLARKYVRFEIRGKLGRGVPVLIDNEVLDCLNLIIEHRENAGVPQHNLYLFGLPSNDKDRYRYLRACNLMREYSMKCGAEIPNALRGTKLRKHIATKCVNFNLTDGQVSDLANFMGHHEKIHKEIYRQPVLETDIVKISKILNTAQGFDDSSDESDDDDKEITFQESSNNYSSLEYNRSFQRSIMTPKRWSDVERTVVLSAFERHLKNGKFPSGKEMQDVIIANDCLRGRTVPQLRSWLHTQKKKMTIDE